MHCLHLQDHWQPSIQQNTQGLHWLRLNQDFDSLLWDTKQVSMHVDSSSA